MNQQDIEQKIKQQADTLLEEDTKIFEETKQKYGEARAVVLSEIANLIFAASLIPAIQRSVENLFPAAVDVLGIDAKEVMQLIKRYETTRFIRVRGGKLDS